jgi:DNA (cytosine-5)-methyltransferase 1
MVDQLNMNNISIFDCMYEDFKIDKPIRLIELFAGVGSQAMALRNLGADFEHYKISEWEVSATASYKAIHMENDNTDYSLEIKKNELPQILFNYGISIDGKEPMTLEQIERKGEKWQRITYNNLRATNNLGSICNFKGEDLEIVDTDSFTYLLTYSFPCQDLSVAGKMQGMTKDSGTRSGLLWEVERLLNEVEELPQVLLMENVPQVIGKKNIDNFHLWQQFLEDKGYSNFVDTLNAKNYGVAQNRNRTFMVSILGKWNYNFPKQIPLTKTMKDYLEDEVDEKYYINNEKALNSLTI